MTALTTLKPIGLGFRKVGTEEEYTPCMGVLKGFTMSQDEPDENRIEAEFYDSPFDIIYTGKPVVMNFELTNYDFSTLEKLFGGKANAGAASSTPASYEGATTATTTEWEWKLDFAEGYKAFVIYRGQTIGNIKKDADGALNYSVKITALVYNDGHADHLYRIEGDIPVA